jgi:hypothetical protein
MANIIISYRRSDSAAIAGRIRDRLAEYYGADAIFMDIDSIPFGIDFRQQIQEVVTKNHIMLVLIGPKWMGAKKGGMSRITVMCDAGSRTARWAGGLKRVSKVAAVARRASHVAAKTG